MEWCEVLILGGSIYFGSERAYADDEEKLIRVSCWEEVCECLVYLEMAWPAAG